MEKVIIIGGGIVGTAVARELAKYRLDIVLLEKEPDFAAGATKANSGILHAGFDAPPGSLKAALNVRGNRLYREIAAALQIELKLTSTLVVAKMAEELGQLSALRDRGVANGVGGLEILSREQALAREPNLAADIAGALYAPTGGIMTPFEAALAFAENAARNGVRLVRNCAVTGVAVRAGKVAGVLTAQGFQAADWVINAAGLGADGISRSAGDAGFTLRARKGEYLLFDKADGGLVRAVIFPTPSPLSKGVVIAPTVHGNLFIGPNARDVDDKADCATSAEGLAEIRLAARRLVPAVAGLTPVTQFAGLRAVADGGDFVIRESPAARGLIHAAGIQSPGLTAAPAIAELVAALLRERGAAMPPRADFCPANPPRPAFGRLDDAVRQRCWEQNSLYGRVVCRCETVTEAEIAAAADGPWGALTLDGVKRRTRAGMGRCQGGFCGPRAARILARELGVPLTEIRKETAASRLFYDRDAGGQGGEGR